MSVVMTAMLCIGLAKELRVLWARITILRPVVRRVTSTWIVFGSLLISYGTYLQVKTPALGLFRRTYAVSIMLSLLPLSNAHRRTVELQGMVLTASRFMVRSTTLRDPLSLRLESSRNSHSSTFTTRKLPLTFAPVYLTGLTANLYRTLRITFSTITLSRGSTSLQPNG